MEQRFGRAPYFCKYDTDSKPWKPLSNETVENAYGAGAQTVQNLTRKGVNVVLAGSCGPNSFQTRQAAGMDMNGAASIGIVSERISCEGQPAKRKRLSLRIRNEMPRQCGGKERKMPRGDGTGPQGQGPMTGRGFGRCSENNNPAPGLGRNQNQQPGQGLGLGRRRGGNGMGNGNRKGSR